MPGATPHEPFLIHPANGERVAIPPGGSHLSVERNRVVLYGETQTPPIDCQAQLWRDNGSVRLTSPTPNVALNGQPVAAGAPVLLLHRDVVSIDGVPLSVEWGDPAAAGPGANSTGVPGPTVYRTPTPTPPEPTPVPDEESTTDTDLPRPAEEVIDLSDVPAPPPAPAGAVTASFGFEPQEVEFTKQGIGREAASRLAKRFRWIKVLRSGGMGKVLLVQEVLSGRFVAMKIMLASVGANPQTAQQYVQQFVREAVITARLQHPHIIPVHDLGFLDGDQLYFTMSYVEGDTFKARMPQMDLGDRVRVLRCVALAALHAHETSLWHRDIKPQNILVGELGDTYLIDWGLVSVQPGREYKLNIPKVVVDHVQYTIPDDLIVRTGEALTALSGVLGTPAYMAPETITGETDLMGVTSDVWSLGVILFEALTGRHPIVPPEQPYTQILGQILATPVPAVSEFNPAAPPELARLCMRMLDKNPVTRIDSMKTVIDGLTAFLKSNPHPLAVTSVFAGRPAAHPVPPPPPASNPFLTPPSRPPEPDPAPADPTAPVLPQVPATGQVRTTAATRRLKCPNPSCAHVFDPSQVPAGVVLTCPRCAKLFTLRPPTSSAPPTSNPTVTLTDPVTESDPTAPSLPQTLPAPPPPQPPQPQSREILELERDRYKEKCRILAELAGLGWFEFRRRRELWARLAAL